MNLPIGRRSGITRTLSAAALFVGAPTFAADLASSPIDLVARDFQRHGVSASAGELSDGYAEACAAGWAPACARDAWISPIGADLGLAAKALRPACDAGDATACVVVAWHLAEAPAEASRPDWALSARRTSAACQSGLLEACHAFAAALHAGRGLRADPAGAITTWDAACTEGHGPSCTTLAQRAIARDALVPGAVLTYAEAACTAGDPAGCALLGELSAPTWSRDEVESWWLRQCLAGHGDSCADLVDRSANAKWAQPAGQIEHWLFTGCSVGSGRSCSRLADLRRDEVGDVDSAAALYQAACRLGTWEACSGFARMVLADEVSTSVLASRPTFELACDRGGDQAACSALGSALMHEGNGAEAARARSLLERGCTDPSSPAVACAELAVFYETGISANRDRTRASQLFGWACAAGDAESCYRRGILIRDGVGVSGDGELALELLNQGCAGGVGKACQAAGELYDAGSVGARDPALAKKRFAAACEGRVLLGCNKLGLLEEEAGDPSAAYEAYATAIELGSVEAKRLAARLLWLGEGVKKRRGDARTLCREACQEGDPSACLGPDFQVSARMAVGKRDAVLAPVVAPPPKPVEAIAAPVLDPGMAWLPRPVCEWLPSDDASARIAGDRLRLQPVVLNDNTRLAVAAPADPEPETKPTGHKRKAAADDRGVLVIGAWPGDQVRVGGKDRAGDDEGVVVLEDKEGPVTLQVTGGGRSLEFPVAIAAGQAVWVSVDEPPIVRVGFAVNGTTLDDTALSQVKSLASQAGNWRFAVVGSYSPEGDIQRNLELARSRAAATRAALIEAGVSAESIAVQPPQPPLPGLPPEQQRAAEVRPVAPEAR